MESKGLNAFEYIALLIMIVCVILIVASNSAGIIRIQKTLEKQKSSIVTPTPQKDVE